MSSERLRFSPDILRLLGEDLNPSPDQGILELIKNAYDADATKCIVELRGAHIPGGSLHVSDDGDGLTLHEIREGWLVVGNSLKTQQRTSRGGRLLAGSKGLGRLAALRLGDKVTLVSRPREEPQAEYRVEVDWSLFECAKVVEDVELEISRSTRSPSDTHGTEVLIQELPMQWRKTDVQRLARAILLLTDPFEPSPGFRAILRSKEFDEIASRATEGYFRESDFHLVAHLDEEGHARAQVLDGSGALLYEAEHDGIADDKERECYRAPAARFELWEFRLSGGGFSTKSVTLRDVKGWLKELGGVRLYHRKMRVLPYGEPQNDWLDMNLRRARNPELRPSTNNSLGCVWLEDPQGVLQLKTDRLAFVESDAFDEVRQFTGDVLDWMASERLRERERLRKTEHERVQRGKRVAEGKMQEALKQVAPESRGAVDEALQQVRDAHEEEIKALRDTAQLYYTLGTVGTTAAAFAHQTKHPLAAIVADANALDEWLGDPNTLALYRTDSSNAVKRIRIEADAIYTFANVTLKLLEHEKRRSKRQEVNHLVKEAADLLSPFIELRNAVVELELSDEEPHIWCSRAAFESIITNLISNSLQTFAKCDLERPDQEPEERRVLVRTQSRDEVVSVAVMDNGSGIRDISIEDVWLPGKTTTVRGTGLGLAIVRDVVQDLNGTVKATAQGDLGGAMFEITLPLRR